MARTFKDHFSEQPARYARYRPDYPPALFAYLASCTPTQERAWDCATGNGQAALGLTRHFAHIVATDASAAQVEQAARHERITYRVEPAEETSLAPGSIDLVTVAQAFHWLRLDDFYREVRRVLKPGGVLAAWCYGLCRVSPAVDAVVERYYHDVVGPWWPPERHHVETGYRSLSFPFEALEGPAFEMEMRWTLTDLMGYFGTWSASRRYARHHGRDPLEEVAVALQAAWGDAEQARPVRWPLHLRIGRVG